MEEKKPQETDAEKIARIEKALADKDAEIEQLKASNTELSKHLANHSLLINGLPNFFKVLISLTFVT